MGQWDTPSGELLSDKEMIGELLDVNERMGRALAYAYRKHPWMKIDILQYMSEEGVDPPGIDENVFVTYRRADGKPIFGEYSFMCSYDGLNEEETDIIEERWILEGKRIIPFPQEDDEFEELYEEEDEGVRKFRPETSR